MKAKDFIKKIKNLGWEKDHVNGSHHIYKKKGEPLLVTIPVHGNKDLKPGLLNALMKQVGLK